MGFTSFGRSILQGSSSFLQPLIITLPPKIRAIAPVNNFLIFNNTKKYAYSLAFRHPLRCSLQRIYKERGFVYFGIKPLKKTSDINILPIFICKSFIQLCALVSPLERCFLTRFFFFRLCYSLKSNLLGFLPAYILERFRHSLVVALQQCKGTPQ